MQLQMVLVATVRGVGTLHARGDYTQLTYAIPPQGALVHPYDVDGILAQQRTFCCRGGEPAKVIYPFFAGKATAGQVAYVEVPDPEASRASTPDDPAPAADAEAARPKGRVTKSAPLPQADVVVWDEEPIKGGEETPPGG